MERHRPTFTTFTSDDPADVAGPATMRGSPPHVQRALGLVLEEVHDLIAEIRPTQERVDQYTTIEGTRPLTLQEHQEYRALRQDADHLYHELRQLWTAFWSLKSAA